MATDTARRAASAATAGTGLGTWALTQVVSVQREHAAILSTHAHTSFNFAARFLPPVQRRAATDLYAFFRTLDDLVDTAQGVAAQEAVRDELLRWWTWLDGDLRAAAPREPMGTRLATTLQHHAIPVFTAQNLIEGLLADLGPRQIADDDELERYCFQVASTVGVAMAHILGSTSPAALRAATDLGAAMQLTNIVRDVGEDLALGRVYLPQSLLHRYDLSPTTLQAMLRVGPDAGYCAALQSVMSRATSLYAQSLPGIWLLPSRSRLPILLAGRLYARLLPHIERAEYDTLRQRVSTSRRDKLDELRQCVWLLARPPRSVRPPVALPPPAQGGTPWT